MYKQNWSLWDKCASRSSLCQISVQVGLVFVTQTYKWDQYTSGQSLSHKCTIGTSFCQTNVQVGLVFVRQMYKWDQSLSEKCTSGASLCHTKEQVGPDYHRELRRWSIVKCPCMFPGFGLFSNVVEYRTTQARRIIPDFGLLLRITEHCRMYMVDC